jgi:hypothetical protein
VTFTIHTEVSSTSIWVKALSESKSTNISITVIVVIVCNTSLWTVVTRAAWVTFAVLAIASSSAFLAAQVWRAVWILSTRLFCHTYAN